jgi:alpha,alpha-trehalase
VVEDSRAGIEAGRAGGFAWLLGVDREGNEDALVTAGADAVVGDVGEVRLPATPIVAGLPSALGSWEDVRARLQPRSPAVFLDYDGTLTPIVPRPEDAVLPTAARDAIARLGRVNPVGVVSGRDLDDVRAMVGLDGIALAGSHGFDIVGTDGVRHQEGGAYLPDLDDAERSLEGRVAGIDGVRVERKRFAIAVHHRRAGPEAGPAVRAAVEEVARDHPRLRVTGGKMIVELRPDIPWDKGRAVRRMRELLGLAGAEVAPVYVGDDETDEDAFREVRADGVGVIVRGEGDDRPTLARYSLAGPDEVVTFLERLAGVGGDA